MQRLIEEDMFLTVPLTSWDSVINVYSAVAHLRHGKYKCADPFKLCEYEGQFLKLLSEEV